MNDDFGLYDPYGSIALGDQMQSAYNQYDLNAPAVQPQSPYSYLPSDWNRFTGGKDMLSMQGAFGGVDMKTGISNSGWVGPTLGVVGGLANGWQAYQAYKEQKKNNERNYQMAKEAHRREATRYNNAINEKRRATGLLMGSGNSYGATSRTVARTPYSKY
jgi:hypothetical protein